MQLCVHSADRETEKVHNRCTCVYLICYRKVYYITISLTDSGETIIQGVKFCPLKLTKFYKYNESMIKMGRTIIPLALKQMKQQIIQYNLSTAPATANEESCEIQRNLES